MKQGKSEMNYGVPCDKTVCNHLNDVSKGIQQQEDSHYKMLNPQSKL